MQAGESTATAELLIRGKKWSQEEREKTLISNVNQLTLYPGAGMEALAGKSPTFNGVFFSKKRMLVVADGMCACIHCSFLEDSVKR